MTENVKKYGLRVLIAASIYLFFRLTSEPMYSEKASNITVWPFLLLFAIFVVLFIWEVCDRVILYFARNFTHYLTSKRWLFFLFLATTLATFPLLTAFIYFENYYLKIWLNCVRDSYEEFFTDLPQAFVVAWLLITVEILKVYYTHIKNMEVEKNRMQKEILRTQYESLKNQINPHFLFNNFSVLDALIHTNQVLASDFLNQLSKLYRYILDNRENEMVPLSRELELLDSYMFLLQIRHENCIFLERNVTINPDNFYIPTLSLQMLIENAVKHNSFNKEHPLHIKIFTEDEQFIIVQNKISLKKQPARSTKVGLENIKSRYHLQSDKKVIIYQSEETFKVKLPILTSIKFA
ncbi:histidine kinase [Fulvivirga sp.]|uniref:sensor histidine kinase n=1 Tax=Fulvivirga sp. TaxID=1931237 RepID=UPI0032ECCF74